MSYLVRRLLENTSNEGFLRAKFSEHVSAKELLRDPGEIIRRAPSAAPLSEGERIEVRGSTPGSAQDAKTFTLPSPFGRERRTMATTAEDLVNGKLWPGSATPATTLAPRASDAHARNGASLDELTSDIFRNSPLVNFVYKESQEQMQAALRDVRNRFGRKFPLVINAAKIWTDKLTPSVNPSAPNEIVGYAAEAGIPEAERAVKAARDAFGKWSRTPFEERARLLERAADILERRRYELSAVEVFEVGKPWNEADADIREAVDFCRFYAEQMRQIGRPRLTQHVPGEESYQ